MLRNTVRVAALFGALVLLSGTATAGDISLSLNLEFNTFNDLSSGGTWTVVGKSDERGIAAVVFSLVENTVNFDPNSGFFHSDIFVTQDSDVFAGMRFEIVEGQDPDAPTLDVGVIGGTWPATYVDDLDLVLFSGQPDLGSFSGGVELATGTFDPGVVPTWFSSSSGSAFGGNQFVDESGTIFMADNVFTTVRGNIPEPTTLLLTGCSIAAICVLRRRTV